MSVRKMSEVWELDLPAPEKIVLLKIADCADDAGRNAWPSVQTIARHAGMSIRSVQRVLTTHRASGLLEIQKPATQHLPVSYIIHTSRGVKLAPLETVRGDSLTPLEPSGVTDTTVRGDSLTPDPSRSIRRSEIEKGPSILVFPTNGPIKDWALSQTQIDEWAGLYPGLDVLAEARHALAWILASPERRKTAGGMPKFLVGWLTRSVNSGRGVRIRLNGTRPALPMTAQEAQQQTRDANMEHVAKGEFWNARDHVDDPS